MKWLSLATKAPTPTPTIEAVQQAYSDPLLAIVLPISIALLGLVGLTVAAWVASRSAIRVRLIDLVRSEAESQQAFQLRAVSAVNNLGIATARILAETEAQVEAAKATALARGKATKANVGTAQFSLRIEHNPVNLERLRLATEDWRSALAESHYYGDQSLADVFQAFDSRRELTVNAINGGDLEAAQTALDLLTGYEGRQVYRALQVLKVRGTLGIAQVLQIRHFGRYVRAWRSQLEGELVKGETLIEDAHRVHAAQERENGTQPGA